MEITFLQLLGAILIYGGISCYLKGEIKWSVEASPGAGKKSTFHIDLTPDKYKYRDEGVYSGKWVKPICVALTIVGLLLVFIFKGESVAFTL